MEQPRKKVPTWVIVVGVLIALATSIGVWGNSPAGQEAKARLEAKDAERVAAEASQPKPMKNAGQKTFGSDLLDYHEEDDHIAVSYIMATAEMKSIHGEIKRFMKALMDEGRGSPWVDVTITANGYQRDQYGKETTAPAYEITILYEEAIKVESWPFADIEALGRVSLQNVNLR